MLTSVSTVGFRRNTSEGISVEDLTSVWGLKENQEV